MDQKQYPPEEEPALDDNLRETLRRATVDPGFVASPQYWALLFSLEAAESYLSWNRKHRVTAETQIMHIFERKCETLPLQMMPMGLQHPNGDQLPQNWSSNFFMSKKNLREWIAKNEPQLLTMRILAASEDKIVSPPGADSLSEIDAASVPSTDGTSANEGKRWTPERLKAMREMRDRIKSSGVKDYAKKTADHYKISAQRMRNLIPTENSSPVAKSFWPSKTEN